MRYAMRYERSGHVRFIDRIPSPIWAIATLLLLGLLAWTVPARAQTDAEVRVGFYTDPDAVSFGGGILTPLSTSEPWMFNPNVEFAIGDFANVIALNADFHYDFPTGSSLAYWMGAGPAVLFTDRDVGGTDTDIGLNIIAGLGARYGAARPFVQMKGVVGGDSRLAIAGGMRF